MNHATSPLVELAVVSDQDFIIPTAVMLTTAKQSKAPTSRYRIHLFLTSPLDDELRDRLAQLADDDFDLRLIPIQYSREEQRLDADRRLQRFSGATMVRLRLPELLPHLDRVLYLDGDILIRKDLTAMYQEELGEHLIGAVLDMGGSVVYDFPTKLNTDQYVNSGVLLMNLERLRRENTFALADVQRLIREVALPCLDQDIVNILCNKSIRLLPLRYNAPVLLYKTIERFSLEQVNEFYGIHYESWSQFEEDAVVIHLSGHKKPWKFSNVLFSDIWMEAYRLSPFGHLSLLREVDAEGLGGQLSPAMVDIFCHQLRPQLPWAGGETEKISVRLLGFLPLLTLRQSPGKRRYMLLGFLPLLKVKERKGMRRYLLFDFIPLLSLKSNCR